MLCQVLQVFIDMVPIQGQMIFDVGAILNFLALLSEKVAALQ